MSRILHDMEHIDRSLKDRPLTQAPYSLSTPNSFGYENESTPSSSASRISPVLLLVMVILAVIFFVSGVVHLLVRCLKQIPSPLPNHQSNRFSETPFQRQLQQLFRLHDSGLDQALIDALPVFYYKEIVGLKEPFDCAVCLCEFSEHDKLRLLPSCSHAFHIACIDTWLLSNSSCPLCRGNLSASGNSLEIPVSSFEVLREISNGYTTEEENGFSGRHQRPDIVQESAASKRVFSVKLGKMKSMKGDDRESVQGEISSRCINMDTRRCYSMGAFQYVLVDSDLQVALGNHNNVSSDSKGNSLPDGELEGKRITGRARGESYSVSKIWLWSKKSKLPSSSPNPQMAGLASSLYYYKFPHELQSS